LKYEKSRHNRIIGGQHTYLFNFIRLNTRRGIPHCDEAESSFFQRAKGASCLTKRVLATAIEKNDRSKSRSLGPSCTGGLSFGTFLWPRKEKYNKIV